MGRELRMVPANWQHPKNDKGDYEPLYGGSFRERLDEWNEANAKWEAGFRRDYSSAGEAEWVPREAEYANMSYSEYDGDQPRAEEYMPDWPAELRTHYQMYEDTSEGTPISPVMETPEQLARWLADNKASAFGDLTASYEAWLATIRQGSSVGAVYSPSTGIISGVEANAAPTP